MPATGTRPLPGEYAPFYEKYVARVKGDVLDALERQMGETAALLAGIPEARAGHRYAPGKWSIREVAGHLADTERIMVYRALRAARGDRTPLPGFEEDDYVAQGGFDARPLAGLAAELEAVRRATLLFFRGLPPDAWARRGVANGAEMSVRALAHVVAGHELHHREVLRTRYLDAVPGAG